MALPVVMFGIGATKAGTSWLHRYLSDHPDCAMSPLKELHYFDRAEVNALPGEVRRLKAKRAKLAEELAGAEARKRDGLLAGIAAIDRFLPVLRLGREDRAAYLAFLTGGAGGRRLVGDITPSYALTAPETLARMQGIAPEVRFVYLLRDPVDRLWSHLRMLAQRAGAAGAALQARAEAIFDAWARGDHPEVDARGDYAGALAKFARALRPDTLFTQFYETLFSDAAMTRLCRFLGIAPQPGRYGRRVHAGPEAALSTGRLAVARSRLAPQYAEVAARLGPLPRRWLENCSEATR